MGASGSLHAIAISRPRACGCSFFAPNRRSIRKSNATCAAIAIALSSIYLGLTILAALVYWLAGMSAFDAIAHALTSIATGGYSTSDRSFGAWEANGIQWFATVFMLSGSIPFVLYVRFIAGEHKALWDRQVRSLVLFLCIAIISLGLWLTLSGQYDIEPAFRHAAFNTVSVVTTTVMLRPTFIMGNAW